MELRQKVGKLFIVRPEALDPEISWTSDTELPAYALQRVNDRMRRTAELYPVGGVLLYGHNISDPQQLRIFTEEIHSLPGKPLVCIDEEGGRVSRISRNPNFSVPRFESAAALAQIAKRGCTGRSDDLKYAGAVEPLQKQNTSAASNSGKREEVIKPAGLSAVYEAAKAIGGYLKEYGIDLDFAPVADVNTNPCNIIIGDRALSDKPETAAPLVADFVRGLADAGIISCLKHFPGHGDTIEDTHSGFAVSNKDWEEISACEMQTFRAGIAAGVPMIMSAHIAVPAVTGTDIPATLSPLLLQEKLRTELGFNGVIISDALEMGAIAQRYTSAEAAVGTFLAGADLILNPASLPEAFEAMLSAVRSGKISEQRLDESLRRIEKVVRRSNRSTETEFHYGFSDS